MKLPSRETLPLKAPQHLFTVDETKVGEFYKAFREKASYIPPTLMAVSMKGIFDLLNQFEIDWKKLLHATQGFTYHESVKVPSQVEARTRLMDIKTRASLIWFQFETEVVDSNTQKPVVTCRSLLMTSESPK